MANIKSAKKRIKVAANKAERNKAVKSRVKTELKKFDAIVEAGDKSAAEAQLKIMISRENSRYTVIFVTNMFIMFEEIIIQIVRKNKYLPPIYSNVH